MSALEVAVRVVVGLLVRGEYGTIAKVTQGRRLAPLEMMSAVVTYGKTLVAVGPDWWSTAEITPIIGAERAFHVVAPLWTLEEGRSDLSIELKLTEFAPELFETEVLDIHVL